MKQVTITDHLIVDKFFARDESAIEMTHQKYGGYLYTIAYNILQDTPDCEECRNDTYLGLWNAIPPHKPQKLAPFAAKIMRRIAINRYEQKSRQKRVPSAMTISIEELHGALQSVTPDRACAISDLFNRFIRALPDKDRYIFVSRYCYAQAPEQIARTLGTSRVAVYKRLDKIKAELKIYLEKEGESI